MGRRESCKLQLITTNIPNFLLDGSGVVAIATVASSNSVKFLMDSEHVHMTVGQSVNWGEVRVWAEGRESSKGKPGWVIIVSNFGKQAGKWLFNRQCRYTPGYE